MAHTMPDSFPIEIDGMAISAAKTELTARQHTIVIDEPPERGGTDIAATPLEHMLSSFLACTNVITQFVAVQKRLKIRGMSMSLVGHFDTRGVFEKASVRCPFPTIEMKVEIQSDMSLDELHDLKAAVARRCPVSVILREAGCQIEDVWQLMPST
ncbi:OsmC family protein [Hoeflea prorocentri]|uniref:OsmC family protein n=1 Tax=Hoeflea prorocentri TaxID=1922333 RepID=A0A9X3UN24_9HYPH|nr:OsmC family protein [Hoeflea prorocentri]MCY6383722.1 OsmC family protein [Hoeflea prorocentri]MDA5401522.1 OsmC family protein [Hoeflea prorocentri]